jgi:hypothetical protein
MGLRVPSPIRCLNLSEQIAQKLHACTGPYSAGRARAVLDILLIEMLGKLDSKRVRARRNRYLRNALPMPFRRPFSSQRNRSQSLKCWRRS